MNKISRPNIIKRHPILPSGHTKNTDEKAKIFNNVKRKNFENFLKIAKKLNGIYYKDISQFKMIFKAKRKLAALDK